MRALMDYCRKVNWSSDSLIAWHMDGALGHAVQKQDGELVYFLDDPF